MYYDHPDDDDAYRVPQPVPASATGCSSPRSRRRRTGRRAWAPCARGCRPDGGPTCSPAWSTAAGRRSCCTATSTRSRCSPRRARSCRWRPVSGIENPDALELRVYAGADGEFTLAEERDDERWAFTRFTLRGDELRIHPVDGERGSVPATRRYDVVLCGFTGVTAVEVDGDRAARPPRARWPAASRSACRGRGRGRGRRAPAGRRHHPRRQPGRPRAALRPAGRRADRAGDQGGGAPGRDRPTTRPAPSPRSRPSTCRGRCSPPSSNCCWRSPGYIRSGAAIPSRPSPSCRVAAASRHSASRLARTSSGAESTGQFS